MAQKRRSPLEHRSNRLKLDIRKKPYFDQIQGVRGVLLGYRRTKDNGTWVVRVTKDGGDWTKAIGKADDHDETKDHPDVLTYEEAQDEAKKIAKAGKPVGDNTVKAALDRYETDLESRGADPNNVKRTRRHLTEKLANKAVGSLTKADLKTWRDGLMKTRLKPASVNRTMSALRAALNLAAEDGGNRVTNREAWKSGLKPIGGASKARNGRIMETAAGIEEPLLPRLLPQMSSKLAIIWELFYEPEDRAESLRYWLVAERLWPMLKINGKEISQVPG
jgi:hypothetical protein